MTASGPFRPAEPDLRRTAAYDYPLPEDRIARHPADRRDRSRLLVVPRNAQDPPGADGHEGAGEVRGSAEPFRHLTFADLPSLLAPGDLLVVNESRVLPVRLLGRKPTGAACEVLLLRPLDGPEAFEARRWEALVRPGGKLRPGHEVVVDPELRVAIEAVTPEGGRIVRLLCESSVPEVLERVGRIPLPPYLARDEEPEDRERYQTVYARAPGSVAAPTAGLHFTEGLLEAIRARGVDIAAVTLHVGPGTFRPVESEVIQAHELHEEFWRVPAETAAAIEATRSRGGRVWAVGTTVVRTLESAVDADGAVRSGAGHTRLFIRPGFRFRAVDALVTNFHLPRSTLLMLVAAFAGYRTTLAAYREAIDCGYRFYSYGDAMVVLPTSRAAGA